MHLEEEQELDFGLVEEEQNGFIHSLCRLTSVKFCPTLTYCLAEELLLLGEVELVVVLSQSDSLQSTIPSCPPHEFRFHQSG